MPALIRRTAHRPGPAGHTAPASPARRRLCGALAGGLTGLTGLAGLGGATLAPAARACEFTTSTLRVTHPWAMASREGADEAAVYLRIDEVISADRLLAVSTPLARGVRLHTPGGPASLPLPLAPGQTLHLAPGEPHLVLTGLLQPLLLGRAYPLTLQFERGGEMPAQLSIDFPGPRFS